MIWIGNWIYWTLETNNISNYNRFTNSYILQFTTIRTVCCVFISRFLVTASNAVDSSASVFTSLRADDCLVAPHGRNPCPLSASWLCLPTTG
jgi:hypothetical protein